MYYQYYCFIACSSLVGSLGDCVPSAMIVTSVMTPPQAYWIRYAQTEAVEVRTYIVYVNFFKHPKLWFGGPF